MTVIDTEHPVGPEPTLTERIEAILAVHALIENTAGGGVNGPAERWTECSCGVQLTVWQEHYDENDDDPVKAYAGHIAFLVADGRP